jgi:EmrB/QacA subfamily drug resistance transporter
MKPPCDDAAIRSATADSPCRPQSGPWILAAAILGTSMAFIDSTVVNVALPALQSSFKAGIIDVQWVVEAYGLFLGALILVGGAAGDRFGRRKVFLSGIALFALASAACGLAQTIHQLIAARALQGVGAAFLTPGSLAIISASFPAQERGRAIGTWSGFSAITTALGPVLGGWLIQHASWRLIFFINLPLAAAVILISIIHVPESRGPVPKRLDLLGALVVTIGLGGLVFGLIESPRLGWTNLEVSGSLLVAIACLISFPIVEARAPSPMVPLGLFRSRTFSGANLLTLFLYAALGIFFFIFPMNLIQLHGYSATAAGAAALPLILSMFFLSRWSGGLVARYGARRPLIIGPLIAAAGFALFAVPGNGGAYWRTFFPPFVVLGFGMAVSVAPLTTVVMGAVDQKFAGVASGINNAVARVAGLLAIAVFGIVMVKAFAMRLDHELVKMNLSPSARNELLANRTRLAAIEIPSTLDPKQAVEAKATVANSFLFAFRLIACCCATLAGASAVTATLLVEGKNAPESVTNGATGVPARQAQS